MEIKSLRSLEARLMLDTVHQPTNIYLYKLNPAIVKQAQRHLRNNGYKVKTVNSNVIMVEINVGT